MNDRPCDICKRPLWDGGHALNARECDHPGGEKCRLYAEVFRMAGALLEVRRAEEMWQAGDIPRGELEGRLRESVRKGLDESLPVNSMFVGSWCGGEQSEYARLHEDRNRLIRERDEWAKVAQEFSNLFDPMLPTVSPASFRAVMQGVKTANANMRTQLDKLKRY